MRRAAAPLCGGFAASITPLHSACTLDGAALVHLRCALGQELLVCVGVRGMRRGCVSVYIHLSVPNALTRADKFVLWDPGTWRR